MGAEMEWFTREMPPSTLRSPPRVVSRSPENFSQQVPTVFRKRAKKLASVFTPIKRTARPSFASLVNASSSGRSCVFLSSLDLPSPLSSSLSVRPSFVIFVVGWEHVLLRSGRRRRRSRSRLRHQPKRSESRLLVGSWAR